MVRGSRVCMTLEIPGNKLNREPVGSGYHGFCLLSYFRVLRYPPKGGFIIKISLPRKDFRHFCRI